MDIGVGVDVVSRLPTEFSGATGRYSSTEKKKVCACPRVGRNRLLRMESRVLALGGIDVVYLAATPNKMQVVIPIGCGGCGRSV